MHRHQTICKNIVVKFRAIYKVTKIKDETVIWTCKDYVYLYVSTSSVLFPVVWSRL